MIETQDILSAAWLLVVAVAILTIRYTIRNTARKTYIKRISLLVAHSVTHKESYKVMAHTEYMSHLIDSDFVSEVLRKTQNIKQLIVDATAEMLTHNKEAFSVDDIARYTEEQLTDYRIFERELGIIA
uniref:hypothetical protein n=1 Tax=Thaumasiovibrio occultus TaxID=1891184 RepID=UPI000B357BE7|nr:hypothetical protein [Thaumasiovibrio occultus]